MKAKTEEFLRELLKLAIKNETPEATDEEIDKQIEDKIWSSGNCSPQWLCRCSCGNQVKVCGKYLKNGHKKSPFSYCLLDKRSQFY